MSSLSRPKPTQDQRSVPRRAARRKVEQLDFFRAPKPPRPPLDFEQLTEIGVRIWSASKPVAGTLGERVFRDLRIETPGPHVVRFCANLKRGDTRSPGLVWLLRWRDRPCGVVRLYLDEDGRVVERRTLGRVVGASVVPRPP
jgi:hypothetical protein